MAPMKPAQAAALASGVRLRAYKFDRYKTKKKDGEDAALQRRRFGRGRTTSAPREKPSRPTRTSSMA